MNPSPVLLASAPDLISLGRCIRRYLCDDAWSINPDTLTLNHPTAVAPPWLRIRKLGRRWRLESVQPFMS